MELGFHDAAWQTSLLLTWAELYAPTNGLPAIELDDFESVQRTITQYGGSSMVYYFSLHAQILLLQSRPWDAWRALDEGLRLLQERGLSSWPGGIYFLQGEILLSSQCPDELKQGGGPAEAERLFQKALEQSRRHIFRPLESRAALSLGSPWKSLDRTEEARDLVAQASRGFTGDCHYLREARAFLDSCSNLY